MNFSSYPNILCNIPKTVGRFAQTFTERRQYLAQACSGYIGWIGHNNLGDEAMFAAAQKLFPSEILLHFDGVQRERILAALGYSGNHYFKKVLLGGGTLVNDGYFCLVERALSMGLELSTLGTGIGSSGFSSPQDASYSKWLPLLKHFKHLGVRGPLSLIRLQNLGIGSAEVTGDLALALTKENLTCPAQSQSFAFNVCIPQSAENTTDSDNLIASFIAVVRSFYQQGMRPVPIALAPDDFEPTRIVLDEALGKHNIQVQVPANHEQYFALVQDCAFMIGVRLHAAVLSCCVGVPPLLIGYRDKCADFMESMELDAWLVPLLNLTAETLWEHVETLSRQRDSLAIKIHSNALKYRKKLENYACLQ